MKNRNENSSKIDFVILWVDDQDEEWLQKKKKWQKEYQIIDDQEERYRSWDNLHYLFRSIDKYAPWVNHIYLVTDNQTPDWLKTENNNVSIIDHTEIMEENQLPSFSASAIELNIYKIPGLSENFVYFNDDIFILDHVSPEDFFINGMPRELAALNIIIPSKKNPMRQVMFNNMSLINDSFDKNKMLKEKPFNWLNYKNGPGLLRTLLLLPWSDFSNFKQTHLTASHNKSTYEEVWAKYGDELNESSMYKFRNPKNYNQWLIKDWQLASNNFVPQKLGFGKVFQLSTNNSVNKCAEHINKSKTKIICVNDTELLEDFNYAKNKINSELDNKLPTKSKYEL